MMGWMLILSQVRAIPACNMQADTAHFHFQDNLNKSLRQCGRILVDLYPRLYDTPMVRRIIGKGW